jgi:hypothetical protein
MKIAVILIVLLLNARSNAAIYFGNVTASATIEKIDPRVPGFDMNNTIDYAPYQAIKEAINAEVPHFVLMGYGWTAQREAPPFPIGDGGQNIEEVKSIMNAEKLEHVNIYLPIGANVFSEVEGPATPNLAKKILFDIYDKGIAWPGADEYIVSWDITDILTTQPDERGIWGLRLSDAAVRESLLHLTKIYSDQRYAFRIRFIGSNPSAYSNEMSMVFPSTKYLKTAMRSGATGGNYCMITLMGGG